jgi:MFS family permease
MGVASLTPALPKISVALNLSKTQVALLISAFTFPGIFLTPVAGIMADRWGRKTVLAPSLFIFAIAGFLGFYIHNYNYLILLRVLQGVGAASLGSLNITLIGDFYQGKDRPLVIGYNASILSLSTAFFPLIGGLMASFAWYYPFLLPLLAIPVGLFVIFGLDEIEFEKAPNFLLYLKSVSKSIFKKEVIGIFILSILTFVILYGAFLTYMPFLLNHEFNLTAPKIGIVLSLSSFSTAIVATQVGKLTSKFGSVNLLITAFVLYLITALLIPHVHNLYGFIVPVTIFGVAQALNIPSLQTVLTTLAPNEQRGIFMSLNGMVLRIGQTLGPIIIGIGFTFGKFIGAYYLAAFIAVIGLLVIFALLKNYHQVSNQKK